MHSTGTMRDLAHPLSKKTTSLRASTTLLYTEHRHYLPLLTLSLATTSPYLLSHQKCRNTYPLPVTSRTQIASIICAEAVARPPDITTLAPTKMMVIGYSLSAILKTPSSRKPQHRPTLRMNLRASHLHQSTQRSLRGTRRLQSNKSE